MVMVGIYNSIINILKYKPCIKIECKFAENMKNQLVPMYDARCKILVRFQSIHINNNINKMLFKHIFLKTFCFLVFAHWKKFTIHDICVPNNYNKQRSLVFFLRTFNHKIDVRCTSTIDQNYFVHCNRI